MSLTIKDLEEAVIALRCAADGGVFVTGDRMFVEAVKPLEAELKRLKQPRHADKTYPPAFLERIKAELTEGGE